MATSPLFGWQEPDDTDLVKDGAAAIRTLGNAIDTSMGDLLGGTTGQVLSKASNTDMDFSWVTSDDANAIQNAIVDAKGDLIAASAADTPARLAVGNNGETLVADSSATTGLRWQGAITAGKNAIINGGMDIWQRGTSSASNGYTTVDRFYCSSSSTCTFAQDTTYVPDGIRYAVKGTAGATTNIQFLQVIETANALQFANKTVTLSAYVGASTSTNCELVLAYSTSVDNGIGSSWTTITATTGGTGTATSTVSRVSGVFAVPSTAKSLRVLIGTSSTVANTVVFATTGVQLELGSVPTTFSRAGGTIAGELAACQRYLPSIYGGSYAGYAYATNSILYAIPFPVKARVAPTGITVTGTWTGYSLNTGSNFTPTFNLADMSSASIDSSGGRAITAGQGSRLESSGGVILFTGCEL